MSDETKCPETVSCSICTLPKTAVRHREVQAAAAKGFEIDPSKDNTEKPDGLPT